MTMFKVSQEIRLNTSGQGGRSSDVPIRNNNSNHTMGNGNNNSNSQYNENDCVFGKYQRTPDADQYPANDRFVFVAPELTDVSRIQLLHFPNGVIRMNSDVNFVIKRNGVKGNFEVKMENPSGVVAMIPLRFIDPERFGVNVNLSQAGLYKVHIKCNSVTLPKSPFLIVSVTGEPETPTPKVELPIFQSDASKVTCRGFGLTNICLNEKNEFTIDGSAAGNNILFVGILGPNGQCDEVIIKHLGKNVYKVIYQVKDPGDYMLAAKWGEEHIPGSPFYMNAM